MLMTTTAMNGDDNFEEELVSYWFLIPSQSYRSYQGEFEEEGGGEGGGGGEEEGEEEEQEEEEEATKKEGSTLMYYTTNHYPLSDTEGLADGAERRPTR